MPIISTQSCAYFSGIRFAPRHVPAMGVLRDGGGGKGRIWLDFGPPFPYNGGRAYGKYERVHARKNKGCCPMERKAWEAEFSERFARHEEEMKWLYLELYHDDETAYDYFVIPVGFHTLRMR